MTDSLTWEAFKTMPRRFCLYARFVANEDFLFSLIYHLVLIEMVHACKQCTRCITMVDVTCDRYGPRESLEVG